MESDSSDHIPNAMNNDKVWTSILPNEILYNIFSRIDKPDCIESLRVCRYWNASIPDYTTDVWQSVVISNKKLAGSLPRFLGPHVKDVQLTSFEAAHLLEALLGLQERQCQSIRTLDISFSNHFTPIDHLSLISLLPVHSLTTLILRNLNISNIDLISIVTQCPTLLHLSYTARTVLGNERDNGPQPILSRIPESSSSIPSSSDLNLPLQTLYFEGNSTSQQAELLMELVRHAPGLRALAIATIAGLDSKELRKAIRDCRELEYFGSDVIESWAYGAKISNIHTLFDSQAEKEGERERRRGGLRTLGLFDMNGMAYFTLPYILMLKEHQETLEHLIMGVDFDPDSEDLSQITYTLAHIHLSQLESFSWSSEYFPAFAFTRMLSHCQNLREFRLTTWSTLDARLCRTLAQLPALESIRFCFKIDDMTVTEQNLFAFFDTIRRNQSSGMASRLSTVEMALFGWSESGDDKFPFLEPLAAIRSLRHLVLSGFIIIDDDTMLDFTRNLVDTANTIEDLEIRWLIGMPDGALENLTKLDRLRRLHLLHCRLPRFDSLKMLDSMARRSTALEQVTVCDCDGCHEDDEYDIKQVVEQGSMDWLRMVNQPF